mmetsp:Transcript_31614/g.61681  ORF Transcript_31614/g.61681 Transcript_31614/m.61681 type:complete len:311 (+) Transcript_31614:1351-2283(+)
MDAFAAGELHHLLPFGLVHEHFDVVVEDEVRLESAGELGQQHFPLVYKEPVPEQLVCTEDGGVRQLLCKFLSRFVCVGGVLRIPFFFFLFFFFIWAIFFYQVYEFWIFVLELLLQLLQVSLEVSFGPFIDWVGFFLQLAGRHRFVIILKSLPNRLLDVTVLFPYGLFLEHIAKAGVEVMLLQQEMFRRSRVLSLVFLPQIDRFLQDEIELEQNELELVVFFFFEHFGKPHWIFFVSLDVVLLGDLLLVLLHVLFYITPIRVINPIVNLKQVFHAKQQHTPENVLLRFCLVFVMPPDFFGQTSDFFQNFLS